MLQRYSFLPALLRWLLPGLLLLLLTRPAQAQNVGIGTTAPTQTLDVNGSLRVRGLSSPDKRLLQTQPDGTMQLSSPLPATVMPTQLASGAAVATGPEPSGLAIAGGYLYVSVGNSSSTNAIQVFSLANAAQPALVGSVPVALSTPDALAVGGGYLYLCSNGSAQLQIFSLASPTAPSSVGTISLPGATDGAAVVGSTLYLSNISNNTLQTYSLASPTAPSLLGSVAAGGGPGQLAVSGSYLYCPLYSTGQVQTFSLATPTAPTSLGTVAASGDANGAAVLDARLYVGTNSSNTLITYDLATPATPAQLGSQPQTGQPYALAAQGNYLYVADFLSNSLQVLLINSPAVLGFDAGGNLASVPASSIGGDNLGNHQANQTLALNNNWLSNSPGGTNGLLLYNDGGARLGATTVGQRFGRYELISEGTTPGFTDLSITSFRSNFTTGLVPALTFYNFRGSSTAATPVAAGDNVGAVNFAGFLSGNIVATMAGIRGIYRGDGSSGNYLSELRFLSSGTTRMVLDQYGSLGLGTTSDASARLDIVADNLGGGSLDDMLLRSYGASASPGFGIRRYRGTVAAPQNVQNDDFLGEIGFGAYYNNSVGSFNLSGMQATYKGDGTTSLTDLRLLSSGQERVHIDENGLVGVGTTAPAARLHVEAGSAYINGESQGVIVDAGGLKRGGLVKYAGHYPGLWRTSGAALEIGRTDASVTALPGAPASLTTDMYLDANGNLGVGNTAPTARLEVQGSGSGTGLGRVRVRSTNDQAGIGFVSATSGGTASTEAVIYQPQASSDLRLYVGNADRLTVASTGQVGIGKQPATTEALDVEGAARVGTASTVGEVHTPITGSANMLAVAYGQMTSGTGATIYYGNSGNFTLANIGTGHCRLTFPAGSGLNGTNFSVLAVVVTRYGNTAGSASFTGGVGSLDVYTFNAAGVAADSDFSVVVYRP